MSSPPSVWSRTMSTMTRATSDNSTFDNSTSAPHTPSSTSVVTGLKAALGAGSFFHAHLQEGQRIEDSPSPSSLRYEVSAYAISPNGGLAPGAHARKSGKTSICEESPRVSHQPSTEKAGAGPSIGSSSSSAVTSSLPAQAALGRSSAKKWGYSGSATAMSSDNREFWEMVTDAKAAAVTEPVSAVPRRHHYITRSQSMDAAADVVHFQPAPKMHKKNASYSAGVVSPMYPDSVENTLAAPGVQMTWCPTRGRYLSPIEEVQFFPEKQGDAASLHSSA